MTAREATESLSGMLLLSVMQGRADLPPKSTICYSDM